MDSFKTKLRKPGKVVAGFILLCSLPWSSRADLTAVETGQVPIEAAMTSMISLSADGLYAVCSVDGANANAASLIVVDVAARKTLLSIGEEKVAHSSAAISPDGKTVAYIGNENAVILLSLPDGREVARTQIAQNPFILASSHDGKTLAVGCSEGHGIVFFWNPFETDSKPTQLPNADLMASRTVSTMAFSPDDRLLAFGTVAGDVVMFDRRRNAASWEKRTGREWCGAIAFSRDGKLLAYQVEGGVQIVETEKGKVLQAITDLKDSLFLSSIGFSPDGKWLLYPRNLNEVGGLNVKTGAKENLPIPSVCAVAFTGRGTEFIVGGADDKLRTFQLVKSPE